MAYLALLTDDEAEKRELTKAAEIILISTGALNSNSSMIAEYEDVHCDFGKRDMMLIFRQYA